MNCKFKLSFSLEHWINHFSIYDLKLCVCIRPKWRSQKWHLSQWFLPICLKPSGFPACSLAPRSSDCDSNVFLMLMCEELMQPFGCTLCYRGVTAIHHTGPDTTEPKQQPIQMHHNKMLYLWFVYMHKSAAQPSLASSQDPFLWIESASDHSRQDWLPKEKPRDTEPPHQKSRDNPEADLSSANKDIYMGKQNRSL